MVKNGDLVPIFVPRDVVKKLLKEAVSSKSKSSTNLRSIMVKIHNRRKKLLKDQPHVYIDHSA